MLDKTIIELAELLVNSRHIVVLSGAGMSTESGIPDFRSANGLWTKDMSLAEAISVDYFEQDPNAFWQCFKSIFSLKLLGQYEPNQGHLFLVWLETLDKKVTILTQNIDGLHHRAGSRRIVELHGNLLASHCPSCGTDHGLDYINHHSIPLCSVCGDVLKPNVVLYGEVVPHIEQALSCAASADCLLVMGSSLEVSPVNCIPMICAEHQVPTALINRTSTKLDRLFTHIIHDSIGSTSLQLREVMKRYLQN